MAAASLSDVISRMKDEGQLTRNSGTNSLKSIKQILSEQNDILKSSFTNLIAAVGAGDLISSELKMEQDRYNQRILEALEGLNKKDEKTKPDEDATEGWMALGALGTILAGTIGSAIGLIIGQVKAIGFFAKIFTPEKIKKSLKLMMTNFSSSMKSLSNFIGEKAAKIKSVFSTGLTKLSSLFSFGKESKVGDIISKIGKSIKDFVATFKTIGKIIKDFIVKPINVVKGWFAVIGSYMKSFGNTIGKVAGVIGKIFLPITVLMTAFETITSAVEGYAKDGILGGIKGAIDGLFTSLITKPLDLLKDGVAWVLDKLGFDESSEALSSFSFTEMFTDMTQGILDFVKDSWNFIVGLLGFSEEGMGADIRNTISTVIGDAFNSIVDWINNVFSSVVESISGFDAMSMITIGEDFIKSLIRAVLPPADSLRFELPEVDLGFTKVGGGAINLNPIPDSVYEWAELPAQSPSEPSGNNDVPTQEPQTQLNNLEEAQSSLNQSIDNNTSVSMGGNTSVSTVNAPTSVTTSNSQVYVGSEMDPYSRRAQEDTRYGSGR